MIIYLDIAELAGLMGMPAATLARRLRARPQSVPPKMHLGASNMLRWRKHEVDNWMVETGWSRASRGSRGSCPPPFKIAKNACRARRKNQTQDQKYEYYERCS